MGEMQNTNPEYHWPHLAVMSLTNAFIYQHKKEKHFNKHYNEKKKYKYTVHL